MSNQTTKVEETETSSVSAGTVSRRRFFYLIGWGFIDVFLATTLGSTIRFFFPRIIYEPPTKYKIGSGFTPDGINIEGPAPRPLERFKVSLTEDGEIVVDESTRFRGERGEWNKPGAFVSV